MSKSAPKPRGTTAAGREQSVLALIRDHPAANTAPVIARYLNFGDVCDWCPVGPPRPGERCATVPRSSRERVRRVLLRLVARGLLVQPWPGTRMPNFILAARAAT